MKRVHQIGIEGILFGCDSPIPGNSPREFLERWRKLPLTAEEFQRIESSIAPYLSPGDNHVQSDKFRLPPYRIPWKCEEWDRLSAYPSDGFRLIQFSRVAFNPDKSQGLFAVSNSWGGLCGGGGALIAIREKSEWVFRSDLGCVWVY